MGVVKSELKAGDRRGELTLLEYHPADKGPPRTQSRWTCMCSCGKKTEVRADRLVMNRAKDCGHGNEARRRAYSRHILGGRKT
jgi:hypothetical protein